MSHSRSAWLNTFRSAEVNSNKKIEIPNLHLAKTIAVASGKGGVGKTSVTLLLASEVAKTNKKVLIIDLDFNLSNTALKLGVRPLYGLFDFFSGKCQANDLIFSTPQYDLICGHHGEESLVGNQDFEMQVVDLISRMEKKYDYIFLDCPAGAGKEVLSICSYADKRILVVNPDISSITDVYSVVKLLKNMHGIDQNYFLLNRITHPSQSKRIFKTLISTSNRFLNVQFNCLGELPEINFKKENLERDIFSEEKFDQGLLLKIVTKLTEDSLMSSSYLSESNSSPVNKGSSFANDSLTRLS